VPFFRSSRGMTGVHPTRVSVGKRIITRSGRTAGITSALVLFRLLSSPPASASDPAAVPEARTQPPAFVALATSVCETPDVVRLRILASGDIDPGSVEIRFLGRQAIVRARGADGRVIRSQPFRLPARIVEVGSSADYDAEGALVMTFRRHATVQDATRTSDPEIVRCPRLDAFAERK
jgi:hypothetical protein